ncbi:MAG: hypothetical protein K1X64_07215 [Myxococcaceae bacterium]|nr:hypothetical protein [Myxococcaceae bacterium]
MSGRALRSLGVLAWAAAVTAYAQNEALPVPPLGETPLERTFINPSMGAGLFVPNAESLPKGTWVLGGTLGYAKNPLVLFRGASAQGVLIADRGQLQAHLAYGANDGLMLTAEGLAAVVQRGEAVKDAPAVARWGSGAFRFGVRAQLLSQKESGLLSRGQPVDLTLGLTWVPPLGTSDGFVRETGLYLEPQLGVGHSFTLFRMGGEATVSVRGRTGNALNLKVVVASTEDRLRYELAVLSTVPLDGEKQVVGIEVLGAVRTRVGPVELYLGGGPGFGRLIGTPLLRLMGGAAWCSPP